jgi:hypothetical protein
VSEPVVLASWSHYDVWQLDLELEALQIARARIPVPRCEEAGAHRIGRKSFEETAPPRHRAITDARLDAQILDRLISSRA